MDIIINLWNNWTTYEKANSLILVLIVFLGMPGLVWLFTKQKKLALISLLSLLITGVLNLLALIILNQFFDIAIIYTYKLVIFISFFLTIVNLATMIGYYLQNHKHKNFEIANMKLEMRQDTLRLSLSSLLLFSGFAILTPTVALPIFLSLGLSIISIWIDYLLLCKLLK